MFFSFKKVDRRIAKIHVFTKAPPTQRSHAKWTAFILYRAQHTNVNITK